MLSSREPHGDEPARLAAQLVGEFLHQTQRRVRIHFLRSANESRENELAVVVMDRSFDREREYRLPGKDEDARGCVNVRNG